MKESCQTLTCFQSFLMMIILFKMKAMKHKLILSVARMQTKTLCKRQKLTLLYERNGWAKSRVRSKNSLPPDRLDILLPVFFMNVCKVDGVVNTNHKPLLLSKGFWLANRRVVFNYQWQDFAKWRAFLESKGFRRQGKSQKPNKAQPLINDEFEKLREEKHLGGNSPQALIRTVWFHNTVFLWLETKGRAPKIALWWYSVQKGRRRQPKIYIMPLGCLKEAPRHAVGYRVLQRPTVFD